MIEQPQPQTEPQAKKTARLGSLRIGSVCIFSYMVSYICRNLLSLYSPEMAETGLYTLAFLGYLSSCYLFAYAGGQLVNGILGDILDPILMISGGLLVSGLSCLLFPLASARAVQVICFLLLGYGLSMIRGPMIKIISESTGKQHARVISSFLTFAGYLGPWVTSAMAFLGWKGVFRAAGILSLAAALLVGVTMFFMRRAGVITAKKRAAGGVRGFFGIFRLRNFAVYFFVGGVIQAASSSFGFWLTSYLVQDLGFAKETAQYIYSAIFLLLAVMPFVTLFLLRLARERQFPMIRLSFLLAAGAFALMIAPLPPAAKVICFGAGEVLIGIPSSLLWNVYLPGLAKSGRVSSANGLLDAGGYLFAALTNLLLSTLMDTVLSGMENPWRAVILIWAGISLFGFAVSLFGREEPRQD